MSEQHFELYSKVLLYPDWKYGVVLLQEYNDGFVTSAGLFVPKSHEMLSADGMRCVYCPIGALALPAMWATLPAGFFRAGLPYALSVGDRYLEHEGRLVEVDYERVLKAERSVVVGLHEHVFKANDGRFYPYLVI